MTTSTRSIVALLAFVVAALLAGGAATSSPVQSPARARLAAAGAPADDVACTPPPVKTPPGTTYTGDLRMLNLSHQNLRNAVFKNTHLYGVNFVHADLTGADFTGAVIEASPLATDFSFATLDYACMKNLTVASPVYFTYASLQCTTFDNLDLRTNVVFGTEAFAKVDISACRPRFRSAMMNCEFLARWASLDLSNADITACAKLIGPGVDFSNAELTNADFRGLNLANSKWHHAVLVNAKFDNAVLDGATGFDYRMSGATFDNASARNANFSNGQLYGASFNGADLTGANFAGAFLTSDAANGFPTAAKFIGAHLPNANLSNAKLMGAQFNYASFYSQLIPGIHPKFPCDGNGCATAASANLTDTNFSNAYLYGVDFTGPTKVNGTIFASAILIGSSFAGAQFQIAGGSAPNFTGALLQGVNFGTTAVLGPVSVFGAFVDFGSPDNRSGGNAVQLLLGTRYTGFRNWTGSATPCVSTTYQGFTVMPRDTSALTCPNNAPGPCGNVVPPRVDPKWNNQTPLTANPGIPGWYQFDATWDKATDTNQACPNRSIEPNW